MSARSLVHRLAHRTGWSVRKAHAQRAMRVVMLHGVARAQTEALGRQLAWIRRHFEPVTLPELLARLDDPARITGREVAVTFDDGLRNNATRVAPLLAEHGTPATFFVCPGLITSGRWLWNHEARARLQTLGDAPRQEIAREVGAPGAGVEAIVEHLKGLPLAPRTSAEDAIRTATPDFAPTAAQRDAFDMMSWDELRALDPAWITVGSHSVDHPILPTLDAAELNGQLADSRRTLEAELDRDVPWFCYPNGAEDAQVREAVRTHYTAAVTTVPGLVEAGVDRHGVPRIGAPDHVPELAWRFHRP